MDILFDLDGTLTDPVLGITRCIQHALVNLGRTAPDLTPDLAPDLNSLRRYVGPPLQDSFAELLETRDEVLLAEAIRLYRERFKPIGMFENSVYPDVPEGLEALRAQGHRLWVATSKPHVFAREIVQHFGLAGFFERVYGSELSGVNADKGDLIRHLLAEEAIPPERAWMVGDRMHDVIGARRNGVEAIGVLWGYGSEEELRAAGPRRIVASMAELCEAITAPL
ncbi:MAG: phosphoglycolate phosphatase [Acidobacteriota bacterium]|jgi:phosphoglycolate phosphatase|nr:phosphoglycolate phosphatase [Acidobacteriota bacterium]